MSPDQAQPPFFSVLVPAYNAEDTIAETLESIIRQSYADYEILVINDGSTDATARVVAGFQADHPKISLLDKENGGTGSAYNAGLSQVLSPWVVLLSADDLLEPTHLEAVSKVIGAYAIPLQLGIISVNGHYLYDTGRKTLAYPDGTGFPDYSCSLVDLIDRCFFSAGVVLLRKAVVQAGGFSEDGHVEDYGLFLRVLASGYQHRFLAQPLAIHRRNERQKSSQGLTMRLSDLKILQDFSARYELDRDARAALERTCRRLRRNIALRRVLYALMGAERAERFIARRRDEA